MSGLSAREGVHFRCQRPFRCWTEHGSSGYLHHLSLLLVYAVHCMHAAECNTVRVWLCPHPTCVGLAPLEVADIQGFVVDSHTDRPAVAITNIDETMTCPRCMRCPLDSWPCPQCDTRNYGFSCEVCEQAGEPLVPQRDSTFMLHWLRNPNLQVSSRWSRMLSATETAVVESTPPGSVAYALRKDGRGAMPLCVPTRHYPTDVYEKEADLFGLTPEEMSFQVMLKEATSAADRSELHERRRAMFKTTRGGSAKWCSSNVKGRMLPWERIIRDQKYPVKEPPHSCHKGVDLFDRDCNPVAARRGSVTPTSPRVRAEMSAKHEHSRSPRPLRVAADPYYDDPTFRPPRALDALFSPVHGRSTLDIGKVYNPASGKFGNMVNVIRTMGDTYDDGGHYTGQSMMVDTAKLRQASSRLK